MLPIEESISFFDREDSELMIAMLDGMTDTIRTMSSEYVSHSIVHTQIARCFLI